MSAPYIPNENDFANLVYLVPDEPSNGAAADTVVLADSPNAPLIVTAEEFVAVDEPGASALVGDLENALIAENSDAMFYGDGGAGKTTLTLDLACHLAAGDDWLMMSVPRSLRVLVIENEGPRALFRAKVRRKLAGWAGSPLEDRLIFWEAPWAKFTFADNE